MLCEKCQERKATVHLKKIVGGQETEHHLCEVCAKEQGDLLMQAMQGFNFNNLLSGILKMESPPGFPNTASPPSALRCSECGMTYQQFTQAGRFGCPHCYESFSSRLEPLLRRIQSNTRHTGKVPVRAGEQVKRRRHLDQLRKQLNQAVVLEKFEEAAKLRDEIRTLEQTNQPEQ